MNGVSHTVEVTAATLYEAVALGMAAIRTDEWVNGIAQGLNPVKVRVTILDSRTIRSYARKQGRYNMLSRPTNRRCQSSVL